MNGDSKESPFPFSRPLLPEATEAKGTRYLGTHGIFNSTIQLAATFRILRISLQKHSVSPLPYSLYLPPKNKVGIEHSPEMVKGSEDKVDRFRIGVYHI
jgi:hypothetical protein